MFNKKVVAFVGRQQMGKSTASDILVGAFGYYKMSFADPLKAMLKQLGVPHDCLYGSREQKEMPRPELCGHSARHAMVTLGTEWGRDLIGPNIWVKALEHRINLSNLNRIVVEDVRFETEYEMLLRNGATLVAIERPGVAPNESIIGHRSETWDYRQYDIPVIQNDGSIGELHDKLKAFL